MNGSPFKGYYGTHSDHSLLLDYAHLERDDEETVLFVDGLVAHGHRMFGLPPTEPTYFCKWDFDIGDVLITASLEVAESFGKIGRCLAYSYEDMENSLLIPEPVLYDVTFVSAKISKIKALFSSEKYILEWITSSVDFRFNDLANDRYSERITVDIPSICASILDRFPNEHNNHSIKASFRTSLIMSNFAQKRNMELCREYQQDHIRLHDSPFHRCAFLLDSKRRNSPEYAIAGVRDGPTPSIPILAVPPPITRDTIHILDPNLNSSDMHHHHGSDDSASSSASTISRFNESSFSSGVSTASSDAESTSSSKFQSASKSNITNRRRATRQSSYVIDTEKDVVDGKFLPPRDWKLLEKISADLLTDNNFNLQPTSNYTKGEVLAPMTLLDPATQYDNFVIQFGSIEGDVSPFALGAVNEIIESMGKEDMETSMDTLQIEFFKRLHMRHVTVLNPEVRNIRLIVPTITIKYGDLEIREENRDVLNLENHIYFDFHDLNLVVRLREQSSIDQMLQAQHSPVKHTVYLNLDSATIGLRKGAAKAPSLFESVQEYSPVVLQIDRTEFWWHEEQETTGSLRIKSVDSFVMSDQVSWVAEFLDKNIEELKQITVSSKNESKRTHVRQQQDHGRTAYVLYQLAKAGESFNIQRDPSVLTRPAYIIQSPLHIRASTSWKIIMRLRHILRTVPAEWRDHNTELLINGSFETPPDIKEQTIAIFARWRNWEMTNISSSYVFGYVFMETSLKERLMSVATATSLDIESIALRLQYAESEDYLCFDYLKILFSWSGKQFNPSEISLPPDQMSINNSVLDFESVLSCLHIRSRYSYMLLDVYGSVEEILSKQSKTNAEVESNDMDEVNGSDGNANNKSIPMLAIRSSFLLEQLSSLLVLPSAEIACQGRNIKLTAFYEQLDPNNCVNAAINAVANCSRLGLDINKRVHESGISISKEKMFQILVNSSVLTLSGYGHMATCSKYLAARSTEFNVSLEKDVGVLAEFALLLVRNDWQYINKHLDLNKSISTPSTSIAKPSASPTYSGNMYLQLNAVQANLTLMILPSLTATYQGKNAYIKVNHAFADQVVLELSLEEQLFKIGRTIDEMESGLDLFSVKVTQSVILIRKEELKGMKDHSIDVVGSVNTIEGTTESITKLIKQVETGTWQLESCHLQKQLDMLCKEFNDASTSPKTLAPNQEAKRPAKIPLVRMNISFGSSSLTIPIYGYCVAMELDSFGIQASSFLRFEDGFVDGFVTRTPLVLTTSMDEWRVILYRRSAASQRFTFVELQSAVQFKLSQDGGIKTKNLLSLNSKYTRILFTPSIVQALVEVGSSFSEEMANISLSKSSPTTSETGQPDDGSFKMLETFSRTCIASMLVKDVSVAWLFEDKGANLVSHPGLLVGYELLDIQVESFVANMALKNVYLTPAIEKQIFLIKSVTPRTANSALLPNVELTVEFYRDVCLRLKGESLKLTLLPSFVVLVSMFLDSISAAQVLIEQRAILAETSAKPDTPAPIKPLRLPFSWRLNVKFDGAVIELWDEVEFFNTEKVTMVPAMKPDSMYDGGNSATAPPEDQDLRVPALALQTPALMAVFEYYSNKKMKHLKDRFGCEIVITPTSNVIYSKVVPVVVTMTRLVKDVVRANHQFNNARKNEKKDLVKSNRRTSAGGSGPIAEDVELLFSAIDANIIIRFESQELTLSCLPTAKVSATVSVEQWFIGVNTSDSPKLGRVVAASLCVHNFRASLQHLYSRDVSGFISLENVMMLATKGKEGTPLEPVRVTGKITDIMFDLNMKQMQDLEVFQNIWLPSGPLNSQPKEPKSESFVALEMAAVDKPDNGDKGIVLKYRRASTTVAIPWSVDFAIIKIHGYIDMGQSIGTFDCKLDKFWISLQKNSDWEQHLSSGIDLIFLRSEGRLGSTLSLNKLYLRSAIMWEKEMENFSVPLVQAVAGFNRFDAKVSLEYHTFAMAYIDSVNFAMSNQRDHNRILGDRLIAVGDIGSVSFFFTALAASYFVDIVYTFKRLRKASHASYEAILSDSSGEQQGGVSMASKQNRHERKKSDDVALSNLFSKLRTMFDLRIKTLNLYIFANTFADNSMFTASLNMAHARFIQEQKDGTLESDLRLNMKSVLIALATAKADLNIDVAVITVPEFVSFANESARGGTIIFVPVFHVAMRSWQKFGQSIVEYTFTSSIGGRVDIGWNLGSVSFIREMWENHARALAQRQQTYSMTIRDSKVIATGAELDKNLKEVELNPVYTYVAREPPDIATPQLRQMGEATPPLEWMGLHRQKFPGLTHQFVIVGLQSLVHNIEQIYGEVLGHS